MLKSAGGAYMQRSSLTPRRVTKVMQATSSVEHARGFQTRQRSNSPHHPLEYLFSLNVEIRYTRESNNRIERAPNDSAFPAKRVDAFACTWLCMRCRKKEYVCMYGGTKATRRICGVDEIEKCSIMWRGSEDGWRRYEYPSH
jgi:hypothetical protein